MCMGLCDLNCHSLKINITIINFSILPRMLEFIETYCKSLHTHFLFMFFFFFFNVFPATIRQSLTTSVSAIVNGSCHRMSV
jgi:hypothetical protein